MNNIRQKINNMIQSKQEDILISCRGTIKSFDAFTNSAIVAFNHPKNGQLIEAKGVKFQLQGGGFIPASPEINQGCVISFLNNNFYKPVIVSLIDETYSFNSLHYGEHFEQGAFTVDHYDLITKVENGLTDDMFDEENQNQKKYILYQERNFEEIEYMLKATGNYGKKENGMTNKKSRSTVQCKENGDIDIFVENNLGIRISPITQKISIYSKKLNIQTEEIETKEEGWVLNTNLTINGNFTVNGELKNNRK